MAYSNEVLIASHSIGRAAQICCQKLCRRHWWRIRAKNGRKEEKSLKRNKNIFENIKIKEDCFFEQSVPAIYQPISFPLFFSKCLKNCYACNACKMRAKISISRRKKNFFVFSFFVNLKFAFFCRILFNPLLLVTVVLTFCVCDWNYMRISLSLWKFMQISANFKFHIRYILKFWNSAASIYLLQPWNSFVY